MSRRARGIAATAAALSAALALAPAAPADHDESDLPWPQLLPPQPVADDPRPQPVKHCRKPRLRCVNGLLRRLDRQWRPLHAACDHRAVAAYAYREITRGLRDDLARKEPRFFPHKRWMFTLITGFSNRYFQAFGDYERGRPLVDAWQIAFDVAAHRDVNAGQDVLLFSNAHVQHDLPFALAEVGLQARNGDSNKPDHDGVNKINSIVYDRIEDFIAENYDEQFKTIDMKPLPLEEMGSLEFVKTWREGAWRNAERLLNARTPEERDEVEESIRTNSRVWAEFISGVENPGYRAQRDAYCRRPRSS